VPNCYAAAGHLNPATLKVIQQADGVLTSSSLKTQDLDIINIVVSDIAQCSHYLTAHSPLALNAGLTQAILEAAVAATTFISTFNRINDTPIDAEVDA